MWLVSNQLSRSFFALAVCILLWGCDVKPIEIQNDAYYPIEIYSVKENLSITLPVEIAMKGDRKSFTKLFELYGFSGNGPSIEQVVRKNVSLPGLDYSSEADAFYATAMNRATFDDAIRRLGCVEDVTCLNKWISNARNIWPKE